MQKYLEERDELAFDKIFNQKIGEFFSTFMSIWTRFALFKGPMFFVVISDL